MPLWEFKEKCANVEDVIKYYFNALLEREKERQALMLSVEEQYKIMQDLARDFIEFDIDSEEFSFIRDLFIEIIHDSFKEYKCQEEWGKNDDLSRTLNGILATLDNCDWAIASLFSQMAYRHYKAKEWIPMLKSVFLIRIYDVSNMGEILEYFDGNPQMAKRFFRIDRKEFLIKISDLKKGLPLNMRNLVFLANAFEVHDPQITKMTPSILLEEIK